MESYIKLRICGHGLNLQEITNQLGMTPVNARKKGEIFIDEKYGMRVTVFQEDFWLGGYKPRQNSKLEDEIEYFAMKLKPSATYLKALAEKHDVRFWVSLHLEEIQANVHISPATINALSEMGAKLDCSMMFLKDFYEGNY